MLRWKILVPKIILYDIINTTSSKSYENVDFMILARSDNIDRFQDLHTSLFSTQLGKYLEVSYSYLSLTRKSPYLGSHKHEGQEGVSRPEFQTNSKYIFVYPF